MPTSSSTGRRLLRPLIACVVLVTLLAGCLSPQQTTGLKLLNADRARHGLPVLGMQAQLQAKAQAWAERLARDDRLYHSVLRDGMPSCWTSLGENIGYGGSIGSIEVAYMNSPHHRSNILGKQYTAAAVGVATNGPRIYTVQEFMAGC